MRSAQPSRAVRDRVATELPYGSKPFGDCADMGASVVLPDCGRQEEHSGKRFPTRSQRLYQRRKILIIARDDDHAVFLRVAKDRHVAGAREPDLCDMSDVNSIRTQRPQSRNTDVFIEEEARQFHAAPLTRCLLRAIAPVARSG